MSKSRIATLILFVALVASGCGLFQDNPVIRLWSQTPEILPFVDRYNAVQSKYKIEVISVPSPSEELIISQTVPDLVLSERLSAPRSAAKLENLNPLLRGDGVDARIFYEDLWKAHLVQNAPVVLPFSFSAPVVIFRKDAFPKGAPRMIALDNLRAAGLPFKKTDKTKLKALGFSPLLDQDFLFHAATLYGVDFHADPAKALAWNGQSLEQWIQYMTAWCAADNGGLAGEREFIRTYLYRLVLDKLIPEKKPAFYRLAFYHASLAQFFEIPPNKRENLDLAWLSRDGKIPADDRILFFGVPQGSTNRTGAYAFLKWVFRADTQENIMEENAKKNPGSFGIAGGFSSIVTVNERSIALYAPFLKGRIPTAGEFIFPGPLPETWQKLKNESILPWMYDRIAQTSGLVPLGDRIK
jgi:hypothetical protein